MSERAGWAEEKQSAYLYRVLADVEPDAARRKLFLGLATAAETQAETWARLAEKAGRSVPARFSPGLRARVVAFLIRRVGPRRVLPLLAAMKVRGLSVYAGRKPAAAGHRMPASLDEIGSRHKGATSGGNLRAAVFGVNDGLVSNASLILGVAGAAAGNDVILLSGVAGLLAGAFSMAAGEYLSVRSQREMFEYQIGLEREELAQYPEEEARELALIYEARGVPPEEARRLGEELAADPERALDVMAREELGLNPDELGSPWGAALFSFVSFATGGLIPVLPFLLGIGARALLATVVLTALALFAVGATLSLFTGRRALWGGLRMLLIGGGAGVTTYLIGSAFGVNLG